MPQQCQRPWAINRKSDTRAELLIYDAIDLYGVTAKEFVKDLKAIGDVDRIDVRINSPGGSVFEGLAIFNALKNHPATIDVYIDGAAISMGATIAMVGDTVHIAENAVMMIHEPMTFAGGKIEDIKSTLDMLEKARDSIVNIFEVKTGRDDISELLAKDTWMNAQEAFEMGFADAIIEDVAIVARFDASDIKVPDNYQPVFSRLFEERKVMSDPKAPEAATIKQLEAMEGATPEFILEQVKNQSTLAEAQNALNDLRLAQASEALAAANARIAELEQQKAAPAPQPPATPAAQEPIGNQPVATRTPQEPEPSRPFGDDPVAMQTQLINELKAKGVSPVRAVQIVDRSNPGLFDAVSEAING